MTPREGARLMGLPESYQLPENVTEAWQLVGDGVAVPCVEYVIRSMVSAALDVATRAAA